MKITVNMKPVTTIITRAGLNRDGQAQRFLTNTVNRRITQYMPYRTGALSTKLKYIRNAREIVVTGPYARMQYFGKKMVNAKTGKGPALIPSIGYRYRTGTILMVTDTDLKYDATKNNPNPGPFWDRRMMAAEGKQIAEEMRSYVRMRK